MNKYFYAKIDKGNQLADEYLSGDNEIETPAIPIYFNCDIDNKDEFLRNGNAKEQGRNFFECGENNNGKYIIVIHNGMFIVTKPVGDVIFKPSQKQEGNSGFVKLLPIEIIEKTSITKIPAILASMTANTYYYTGTFREIKDSGNIKAIETILNFGTISCPKTNSPKALLECLSSFELETLIAKIFEEHGCFVPAYRGGNMKGADIFAFNDSKEKFDVCGILIPAEEGIAIQVKRSSNLVSPPQGVDYLIGLTIKQGPHNHDADWFISSIKSSPKTESWLRRSLNWLPNSYLSNNGLP